MDQIQQKLKSKIDYSSKEFYYKPLEENIALVKYLNLLSYKDKITLCRFWTNDHGLHIVIGKWHRIDRHNRYCQLLNSGDE